MEIRVRRRSGVLRREAGAEREKDRTQNSHRDPLSESLSRKHAVIFSII
jgi:hypothetical protein